MMQIRERRVGLVDGLADVPERLTMAMAMVRNFINILFPQSVCMDGPCTDIMVSPQEL